MDSTPVDPSHRSSLLSTSFEPPSDNLLQVYASSPHTHTHTHTRARARTHTYTHTHIHTHNMNTNTHVYQEHRQNCSVLFISVTDCTSLFTGLWAASVDGAACKMKRNKNEINADFTNGVSRSASWKAEDIHGIRLDREPQVSCGDLMGIIHVKPRYCVQKLALKDMTDTTRSRRRDMRLWEA